MRSPGLKWTEYLNTSSEQEDGAGALPNPRPEADRK
jgi:hypothetical protein